MLRVHQTRDHLAAISGVTPDGRLYFMLRDRTLRGGDVVAFLRHLLRQTRRRLLVIWDGGPIHRSRAVTAFLASRAGRRVRVERLPGYAPDLNPDEFVWRHLKHVELRNRCCRNQRHLAREVHAAVRRLRRRRRILAAFVRHLDSD